jgi:hypothetical protein
MATATVTQLNPRQLTGDNPFIRTWLPFLLLLAEVAGVVALCWWKWEHIQTFFQLLFEAASDKELVSRRLAQPFYLGNKPLPTILWLVILGTILLIGFFYIAWMYVRDSRSIGAPWSIFLGLQRGMVYVLLAVVFLMPAIQTWDESKSQAKVVVLFDVSGSMTSRDDPPPAEDFPLDQLPTRQDKVIQFITRTWNDAKTGESTSFFPELMKKNPVYCYRFGRTLDESFLVLDGGKRWTREEWEERQNVTGSASDRKRELGDDPRLAGKPLTEDSWRAWLKPDTRVPPGAEATPEDKEAFRKEQELNKRRFGGTALGEAALLAFNRETTNNSRVQAIVVFSDGRSNEGSTQAYFDLADRAKKANVPVIVLAVGEDRPQVRVEITETRAPQQARPEDRFPVNVEVNGEGLPEQACLVALHLARILRNADGTEEAIPIELVEVKSDDTPTGKVITLPAEGVVLKAKAPFSAGTLPHASVEFQIDAAALAREAGQELPEGSKWVIKEEVKQSDRESELRLTPKVPKYKGEAFPGKEHVGEPTVMHIVNRKLHVLLFAGGANREYQFARTLFVREMDKGRVDLCIHLQPVPGQAVPRPGRVQDIPGDRLLSSFPNRYEEKRNNDEEAFYNLAHYDLIMAFDPDWSLLSDEAVENVERWVDQGGGLVAFGGHVNTLQLARPGSMRKKLTPILQLYPVLLKDSRVEADRNAEEAFPLDFPGASPELEFLKLDEDEGVAQLEAWKTFFGKITKSDKSAKNIAERGFYSYYPVKRPKEHAIVIATFTDPDAKMVDGRLQPYIVSAVQGKGKVVWVGSCELWRLRQYKEAYHERFITKLARYAGAGNLGKQNSRVTLVMGRTFAANNYVQVEAQILGKDMKPLDRNARPEIKVKLPPGVSDPDLEKKEIYMTAKPGSDNGWFVGRFLVKSPGQYNLELKVKETGDNVPGKFSVREANPELDNVRPDNEQLFWFASDSKDVENRVDDTVKKELKARLQRPRLDPKAPGADATGLAGAGAVVRTSTDTSRLYFELKNDKNAELIPTLMKADIQSHKSRGPIDDLWDDGFEISPDVTKDVLFWSSIVLGALALIVAGFVVWFKVQEQPLAQTLTWLLIIGVLLVATVPLYFLVQHYFDKPLSVSYFLIIVVSLLAVEWLSRKLLRLA